MNKHDVDYVMRLGEPVPVGKSGRVRARARSVTAMSSFRSTRAVAGAGAALVAAGAPTLHLLSVRENPVAGPAEGSDVPPGGVA